MSRNNVSDAANPERKKTPATKGTYAPGARLPSYEDIKRKNRAEEEEWAARSGPVTVRYIEKKEKTSD